MNQIGMFLFLFLLLHNYPSTLVISASIEHVGGQQVHVYSIEVTADEAMDICQSQMMEMLTIKSEQDEIEVFRLAKRHNIPNSFWVAKSEDPGCLWIMSRQRRNLFDYWKLDTESVDCWKIVMDYGPVWTEVSCNERSSVICQVVDNIEGNDSDVGDDDVIVDDYTDDVRECGEESEEESEFDKEQVELLMENVKNLDKALEDCYNEKEGHIWIFIACGISILVNVLYLCLILWKMIRNGKTIVYNLK